MKPRDLLETARDLTRSGHGKPRQANLRRATSSVYYALFHTLAKTTADLFIGGTGSARSDAAWLQAYRALDHGTAKSRCNNTSALVGFPQELQDFALRFVAMQEKRQIADYDPSETFYKSDVLLDIEQTEAVLDRFDRVPAQAKRAFAAFLVLRTR
ncbi:hypothetical protein [Afifella marina]|uniref:HEPN domain-containing protein n=1 Tax=Afifella marina DSM 2698 TaxID=1120955 RepID=A0A1G5NQU7_AFIMA|nr:hypothetical protein [Afifella marina]MBK1624561.1 hypothetical protein [Afifella marina DSM 2698]MBK1627454.1 hypothetical protein [Afifella marina]MBK5918512.1 hypothetical protein [Afifella marina]RAI20666.1 hypothetical protein CH311_09800 [Afifella marina DSM 2698]SCZ39060.1 hypothetical protein SAMN03080610_02388 [Afifella marina DSM 2698]